jgi:putative DNA primase/helicase
MTFAQFCAANGLLVRAVNPSGRVVRVPTQCSPKELKGWYKFDGITGKCGIWHGLDDGVQFYAPGADAKPLTKADFDRIAASLRRAEDERRREQADAAKRAVALMAKAEPRSHAYLSRKGFPDMLAPCVADGQTLLVGMRRGGYLVNVQRINEAGEKRFLHGGEVSGTAHTIGSQGVAILCEGFATCLSVAAAIKASKMRAHAVCCFSADNLVKVAAMHPGGVVIGDNDDLKTGTGEKAAKATGLRYWIKLRSVCASCFSLND